MFKRVSRVIALLLALTLALTACGSAAGDGNTANGGDSSESNAGLTDKGDKETVRMIIPGLSETTTIDPVSGLETKSLGEFEALLNEQIPDYNIKLLTIPWDGWIQSMEAMLTAGDADVGVFTNQEAVPGWYMDLTPYLEKDEELNLDNLSQWFLEPAVYNMKYKSFKQPENSGNIYGLPFTIASTIIVYDSQLFKEWGIEELNENMTFAELVDLAEKMTGTNPVTGKRNYGAYVFYEWLEWYSLSYGVQKPFFSETMDINELDMDEYVESIKTSPEAKAFFTDMIRLIDCANEAVATGSGDDYWFTPDNDIAINFNCSKGTKPYMQYVYANDTEITGRFKPLMIPEGPYGEGFPEFYRSAVTNNAKNPDAAWDVIKQIVTNKDIVDFYLVNYQYDKVSCLNDTSGMSLMDIEFNQKRQKYQLDNLFITDDYWHWRTAMQNVNNQLLSKQYTADEAVDAFYNEVKTWVENIKEKSGNQ
ncbi:extracellular solute-binding protein [Lachnospiraceae bacterium 54-53]